MQAFDDMLGGSDPTLSLETAMNDILSHPEVQLQMARASRNPAGQTPAATHEKPGPSTSFKHDPPNTKQTIGEDGPATNRNKKDNPPKQPTETTTEDGPKRKKDNPPKKPKEKDDDNPPKKPKETIQQNDAPPKKPKKPIKEARTVGDIWWCEELGRALRQTADGPETSTEPMEKNGNVIVEFEDGFEWTPPLIPADLAKFGSAASKLPKPCKKPVVRTAKPVQDYLLPTIRAKYKTQGKSSPILSLEARQDRFDLKSAWRQKCQIVVKDEMTAEIAMNIFSTFADCYEHMLMNQHELDFRVCRDCFLEMHAKGMHDFSKGKVAWEKVAEDIKKAFPPKPTCKAPTRVLAPHEEAPDDATEEDDDDEEAGSHIVSVARYAAVPLEALLWGGVGSEACFRADPPAGLLLSIDTSENMADTQNTEVDATLVLDSGSACIPEANSAPTEKPDANSAVTTEKPNDADSAITTEKPPNADSAITTEKPDATQAGAGTQTAALVDELPQVASSPEGLYYWVTKDQDVTARGAGAQQMKRAFKWRPDMAAAYQVLTDSMKQDFRRAWMATKKFDFMTNRRTTTTSFRKRRDEAGKFVTRLQLINILGGTQEPEAVQQGDRYIAMCRQPSLKEYCIQYNDWLGAETFFWVEVLMTSSNTQEWTNTITVESTDTISDSLAAKVVACKAMRAYANHHKKQLQEVSEDDVASSSLGLKGWAELYDGLPQEALKSFPKCDGSNNQPFKDTGDAAVQKAKRAKVAAAEVPATTDGLPPAQEEEKSSSGKSKAKKDQTASRKEKEIKEFLAMEQSSDVAMSRVMGEMSKNADGWSWATDLIGTYKQYRTEVLKLYAATVEFQSLKIAALSPRESQKLKKEFGESYVSKLVEFVTVLGPAIEKMSQCAFQVQEMASAKDAATKAASAPKPKAKAKSKSKLRRSASAKSLPSV
ncbi:unnamed protein product [Symbiodinium microadriaticum]|nr:unnamed protein product [Symbiodinium microadriaticum]CAE7949558.1 unnamed protein product [Symbiodinium sp. KB8]